MTAPVITAPAVNPAIQHALQQWWARKDASDEELDASLRDVFKQSGLTFNAFFKAWSTAGAGGSLGGMINRLDRQEAREAGFTGPGTLLQWVGRALREGWTPERVRAAWLDALNRVLVELNAGEKASQYEAHAELIRRGFTPADLHSISLETLKQHLAGEGERRQQQVEAEKEAVRKALRALDPNVPSTPAELDALARHTILRLAQAAPQEARAAVLEAQSGEPDKARAALNRKVMTRVEWGKAFAHDYVTGTLPEPGEVFDAHHLALLEAEARSAVQPHVLVFVARSNHIPQPGGPVTAHSHAFTARTREGVTYALLYQTIQTGRWEAHVRGEVDPYPAHLSAYLTLLNAEKDGD